MAEEIKRMKRMMIWMDQIMNVIQKLMWMMMTMMHLRFEDERHLEMQRKIVWMMMRRKN